MILRDTIDKIVRSWAPPEDNNPTEDYVQFVCEHTGFDRGEILEDDAPTVRSVLNAMILFEQGKPVKRADLDDGVAMAFSS